VIAGTATPRYVIHRFHVNQIGGYASWRPIVLVRHRFFVNETHFAVTGDSSRNGADWINDWSCETSYDGEHWQINGRNSWPTLEVAERETIRSRTFATMAEALDCAAQDASNHLARAEAEAQTARRALRMIAELRSEVAS